MTIRDLTNQTFGFLTVLEDTGKRAHRGVIWKCQCKCGNFKEVTSNHLTQGRVKSCGCWPSMREDLTGQRFGKLVAWYPTTMKDGTHMYWMCRCDCGNTKEVASNHLKKLNVQSCGCLKKSIGEKNIKELLISNNINFQEQYSFKDLINVRKLRFDFAILDDNLNLIRLIEFDGIQHFKEQSYFTHSLVETQRSDLMKNEYCLNHNIPLVRIPYYEKNNITLDLIFTDKYLLKEGDI